MLFFEYDNMVVLFIKFKEEVVICFKLVIK